MARPPTVAELERGSVPVRLTGAQSDHKAVDKLPLLRVMGEACRRRSTPLAAAAAAGRKYSSPAATASDSWTAKSHYTSAGLVAHWPAVHLWAGECGLQRLIQLAGKAFALWRSCLSKEPRCRCGMRIGRQAAEFSSLADALILGPDAACQVTGWV